MVFALAPKVAGLLASMCMLLGVPANARAEDIRPLKVQFGTVALPAFAAPYVAKESGLYKRAGLDVEFQAGRLSQDTVNTIMAGTSDIGFVLAINQILAADKGQKLVSIGNMYGRNGFGVVIAKDSGITDLAGLEGHSMLVPGGSYQSLFRALFAAQGHNPDTLKYIVVPQVAAMLTTYVGKQADSITTALPFARAGVEATRPSLYIPFADIGDPEPMYVWVMRPDVLARKKDQIRRFMAATYEATGRMNADPSIAVDAYVKSVPGAVAERLVPEYKLWTSLQCAPGQDVVGRASLPSLDTALDLYRKVGLISTQLKAAELATNELFEGADPVSTVKCP